MARPPAKPSPSTMKVNMVHILHDIILDFAKVTFLIQCRFPSISSTPSWIWGGPSPPPPTTSSPTSMPRCVRRPSVSLSRALRPSTGHRQAVVRRRTHYRQTFGSTPRCSSRARELVCSLPHVLFGFATIRLPAAMAGTLYRELRFMGVSRKSQPRRKMKEQ